MRRSGLAAALSFAVSLVVILAAVGSAFSQENPPPGLSREDGRLVAQIDRLIAAKCEDAGVSVAPQSSDAEFLRRAYLDLVGSIPTVGEARRFLSDENPDKRARLINHLLARPDHATHLAHLWRRDLLATVENRDILPDDLTRLLDNWLRIRFLKNDGYDKLAAGLITAIGKRPADRGAAVYIAAHQASPMRLATGTARMFLGVRIDCAQCHDHFFAKWTQEDYWGYAAFFAGINRANPGRRMFRLSLPRLTDDATPPAIEIPETDQVVPPRFLGADKPWERKELGTTRREALAAWVTSPENPYFAKAAVNRLWAVLFGYGLVQPVDDMIAIHPPSHSKILELLAEDFTAHGFNVRRTLRILANTKAYGRTSRGEESVDPRLYARKLVRPLTPEQLHASLQTAAGMLPTSEADRQTRMFLDRFSSATSCIKYQSGIPQALLLINGPLVSRLTNPNESRLIIATAEAPFFTNKERVETLFLAALSRYPRKDELRRSLKYLEKSPSLKKGLSDILWSLLNSSEFALNH